MPKSKTHQGASKRLRITKTGKIMHRVSGQDHYNSREMGKTTKNKRRDVTMSADNSRLKSLIVHN
ncbi:MAG: 50S ribosomal protein L35 [bacterium]|nr:50S ribosomal protein L35 [bacterium]